MEENSRAGGPHHPSRLRTTSPTDQHPDRRLAKGFPRSQSDSYCIPDAKSDRPPSGAACTGTPRTPIRHRTGCPSPL